MTSLSTIPRFISSPSTEAEFDAVARAMKPLCQSVSPACSDLRRGWVVWAADDTQLRVAIAWRWSEAEAGVVTLADPMSVRTNAQLVAAGGGPLAPLAKTQCLVRTVYQLPWQQELLARLSVPSDGGGVGPAGLSRRAMLRGPAG